ncbi:hypothetical protein [Phytomonospora endophytica]|uniref:HEAT repeat domain-containing protein n=1 Tax=Phytomonospora endophytica TaxID=714109 RepID=A0A841FLP4_9ACTN|nr:hypothetical protein [Phytomonospora endophytica]MBB6034107.1 hypothetical protein [Phytomonospora endophytica]GIG66501.1 hypothetical protein Pen01_27960 [Phytomonospora endophytica]
MTSHEETIDWGELATAIGVDPNSGGDGVARRALAHLLGDEALRRAVDWYIDGRPAAEHARSVLWLLRPAPARARCAEIYRTDADPARRHLAVELLRVVATGEDLPLVGEFLADDDPAIQTWGVGVLDQLLFGDLVTVGEAAPYLRAAEEHPNPSVREKRAEMRAYLDRR